MDSLAVLAIVQGNAVGPGAAYGQGKEAEDGQLHLASARWGGQVASGLGGWLLSVMV